MDLTVQNVYGLLLRSRLLPLDEARTLHNRWQKEAGNAGANAEHFLRWLVAQHALTDYQANLLSRGHADSFFLNQYKILDRLGNGRMAGVYKATHELGQRVAIKVLPPSKARDARVLARFLREAKLAMQLKHPNIVRSFQLGKAGELNYLVMEYLEGETLDEVLLRRGRLPPAEAVRLVYQALLGLQHIHEQGMVHRDLKPSNLMLVAGGQASEGRSADTTQGCTIKILDIGLGRTLFDETASEKESDPSLTTEGALLGTPDYMSPEQARDPRTIDIRSDVYGLGCVLYHTLAGQPPFPDTNIIGQMIRHARETARPLKEFNAAVPDGLQQIVNWMMAKEPAQRYPTPERAAQALQVFLAAGVETQLLLEADPNMRSYLSWVETENSKLGVTLVPTGKPPSGTLPAAAGKTSPAAPPAKPAEAAPTPLAKSGGKRQAKKHKRIPTAAPHTSPPSAQPAAAPIVDVELVPLPPPSASKQRPAKQDPWQLTRRDLLMFGSGVAGTLLAIGMAWLLAHLFSPRRERSLPPPDTESDDR